MIILCCGRYHLKDVIVGKIYFLLVRIKIRYMELAIVRRETTGAGNSKKLFTNQAAGYINQCVFDVNCIACYTVLLVLCFLCISLTVELTWSDFFLCCVFFTYVLAYASFFEKEIVHL